MVYGEEVRDVECAVCIEGEEARAPESEVRAGQGSERDVGAGPIHVPEGFLRQHGVRLVLAFLVFLPTTPIALIFVIVSAWGFWSGNVMGALGMALFSFVPLSFSVASVLLPLKWWRDYRWYRSLEGEGALGLDVEVFE